MSSSNTDEDVSLDEIEVNNDPVETVEERTIILSKFLSQAEESSLFDEDDAVVLRQEIDKLKNSKHLLLEKRCQERLSMLKELDEKLDLKKHHPTLNTFFVKKQTEMNNQLRAAKKLY